MGKPATQASRGNGQSINRPRILVGRADVGPDQLPQGMQVHESRSPHAPARVRREPEVIDTQAEIEWTKSRFERETDKHYAGAMTRIAEGEWLPSENRMALRFRNDAAVRDLQAILESRRSSPKAKTTAARELSRLGSSTGEEFLFESLDSKSAELRQAALETLRGWECQVDVSNAHRAARLLSLLDDPDSSVVEAAADLCAYRLIPGTEEKLRAIFERGKYPEPESLAPLLAQVATTRQSVDALLPYMPRQTAGDYHSHHDVFRFMQLIERVDRNISEPVRKAVHEFTLLFDDERYDQNLVRDLALTADVASIPVLEDIRSNASDPVSRMYATRALARLLPERGVELLLDLINEQGPRDVIRELRQYVGEGDFNRVVAAIGDPLGVKRPLDRETARFFWEQFGTQGRAFVEARFAQLDDDAKMWVRWKAEKIDLRSAIDNLRQAGVVETEPEALLEKMKSEFRPIRVGDKFDTSDPGGLLGTLGHSRILTCFDVETSTIPCDHHRLILEFAENTGGRFDPQWPVQIWHQEDADDIDAPYTVQFVYGNRLFRIGAENYGDWYDVEAVVRLMNFALGTAGQAERFISLESGGQVAIFVFADPKAFVPLAEKYGLALSADLNQSMRSGIEFERQVFK